MKISFDAVPLISDRMTGIGWCEAGQTTAMARLHPENSYTYSYFSRKDHHIKLERLAPFTADTGIRTQQVRFSGWLYRAGTVAVPFPYRFFFGREHDITHFFNYIVPPGVSGSTVVTVHDMVYKAFPETVRGRTKYMLDLGLKRSMKRADMIVTDSEFSKSEILKYFPEHEDKLRVVPCGVDLTRFCPCTEPERIPEVKRSLGIEGDYFLYLGTIEPRKNLERLISAYHILIGRHPDAPKLVLAGGKGWLYDGIFAKVRELGMEDRVVFTKYVPSDDMDPLMCGAVAFVFPSIYEGFGMPPLEAMACGVPVLVSDAASLPEVTGDCAVICDPYSEESIADGMERLYTDTELRSDLSRRGLERAGTFTWERSAELLHNIYKELI